MENNKFKVYVPLIKKSQNNTNYVLNDDGTLDITGIASTTTQDLQKDRMLPSAILSMKKQLLTSNKNLHGDHKYGLFNGLLGSINKVIDSDTDSLEIGATILSKYAPDIKEMLDIGVNLGLSIGGAPTDFDRNSDGGWNVKNARLDEISLTAMPANMDTLGTVTTAKGVVEGKCFAGVCNKILKNMEEYNMEDKNQQEPQKNDGNNEDTESKIREVVDELWSEKEQGLVEQITESVRNEVKDIVKDELKKDDNDDSNAEPAGDDDSITKAIKPEEIQEMISKSISDTFGSFEDKFFKNLNDNRSPDSNVQIDNNGNEEPAIQKNVYSTHETAEILMKKQRSRDPLIDAVINNL